MCELDMDMTSDEYMPIQPEAARNTLIVPRDSLKGFSR